MKGFVCRHAGVFPCVHQKQMHLRWMEENQKACFIYFSVLGGGVDVLKKGIACITFVTYRIRLCLPSTTPVHNVEFRVCQKVKSVPNDFC